MAERLENLVKRDFAKKLKEAREAKGFTSAAKFARFMGEEIATYTSWERGQYLPDIPKMARLCQLLDLEPNELVPLAVAKKNANSSSSDAKQSAA